MDEEEAEEGAPAAAETASDSFFTSASMSAACEAPTPPPRLIGLLLPLGGSSADAACRCRDEGDTGGEGKEEDTGATVREPFTRIC